MPQQDIGITGGLSHLAAALAVFLLTHSIPALRPVRAQCVSALGERGYLAAYSIVSLVVSAWVVMALIDAPYVEVWAMTPMTMWITAIVMLPACGLLIFGLTTPNPFSITIKPDAFVPNSPGILAIARHPILMGLTLWAWGHIPPNGSVAAILVFGVAALFSMAGMFILDKRRKRVWGNDTWQSQAKNTCLLGWRPGALSWKDWRWALVAAMYGGLIALHPMIIGVSPLP